MVLQPVQVAAGFTRSSAENSLIHDGVLQCPSLLHQLVHHFLFFRMFMVLLFHKGTGMDFHNNHRESLQQIGILLQKGLETSLAIDGQSVKGHIERLHGVCWDHDSGAWVIGVGGESTIACCVSIPLHPSWSDQFEALGADGSPHHLSIAALLRQIAFQDVPDVWIRVGRNQLGAGSLLRVCVEAIELYRSSFLFVQTQDFGQHAGGMAIARSNLQDLGAGPHPGGIDHARGMLHLAVELGFRLRLEVTVFVLQ
mmetsp:Transcript_28519/g.58924  ORF Transcript_28519/g.58924 Transcript_28519/m.58924 type:complete len:254 (-) Transcript_28519:222-983(-)